MHDLCELVDGPLHWFSDWPVRTVPAIGSLVYTIWDRSNAFVYVGMAGRSASISTKSRGPFGRLESHASGRRSGDQFNLYVCDRFVLPRMHNRLGEIAEGRLSLDELTRAFIRAEFGFRFSVAPDPATAFLIERRIQRGEWKAGQPVLNPLPVS